MILLLQCGWDFLMAPVRCSGKCDIDCMKSQSRPDRFLLNTEFTAPLCDGKDSPVVFDVLVEPRVVSLLYERSPRTVLWRVAEVIVDPVEAILPTRLWTHVCNEILKAARPSFAHSDPSTAVIAVRRIIRRTASSPHGRPYLVLLAAGESVGRVRLDPHCLTEASTAYGSPVHQRLGVDKGLLPAIAKAPVLLVSKILGAPEHSESPSGNVYSFWHWQLPFMEIKNLFARC